MARRDRAGGPVRRTSCAGVAAGVVPVAGLLAEAADAALVTESVVDDLRRLADLPDEDRELLLLSADLFVGHAGRGMAEAARARLLGLPPARRAALPGAPGRAGGGGRRREQAPPHRVGVDALHDAVHRLFTTQADAICAHRALLALQRLSYGRGVPIALRDLVDEAREDPALQELRVRDVLVRWTRGELVLPEPLADDLQALARGHDDAARLGADPGAPAGDRAVLARRALDAATRWLRFANDPGTDLPARRAAEVVRDSYVAAWERQQ